MEAYSHCWVECRMPNAPDEPPVVHIVDYDASLRSALDSLLRQRGRAIAIVDRYATLSPREREVMALPTAGKMDKQIAGELGLSEVTVKIHRGPAIRKMGARSLADLVRMADTLKNRTR